MSTECPAVLPKQFYVGCDSGSLSRATDAAAQRTHGPTPWAPDCDHDCDIDLRNVAQMRRIKRGLGRAGTFSYNLS